MEKVYIEPSIIGQSLERKISGIKLAETLESFNLYPTVGFHTIYENARTYLNQKKYEIAQGLFSIVKELNPSYIPITKNLLKQEILKLRTGAMVLPFHDYLNQKSICLEVERLSLGFFDTIAKKTIKNRDNNIRKEFPIICKIYQNHVKEIKKTKNIFSRIKTFDDLVCYFYDSNAVPKLIIRILEDANSPVSNSEAEELTTRINSFPSLRSAVNANCYLNYIIIKHNNLPSKDKIDDLRHIIDASYCQKFISGDRWQCKRVININKDLKVFTWKKILNKIKTDNH